MRVKQVAALAMTTLLLVSPVRSGATTSQTRLLLDGNDVTSVATPLNQNGRTLVPIRFISEELGAAVAWDGATRTITVSKDGKSALLRIGSRLVEYDGGALCQLSDAAPQLINSLTYVPLRLVGNALGIAVAWDAGSRAVVVNSQQSAEITPFFDMQITSLQPGDTITGKTGVQVAISPGLASQAKELKLLLLDPGTGRGFVVADSRQLAGEMTYLPKVEDQGAKLLVAAIYDGSGAFVGGDAVPVKIDVNPQVALTGLSEAAVVTGSASISQTINFLAPYVKYVFTNQESGKTTAVDQQDPQGTYAWSPTVEQNGNYAVKVIAYDGDGNTYESSSVNVSVAVEKRVSLSGVSAGATVNKAVSLIASRNFDVTETQYVCRDVATGEETILKTQPYGSYGWFPGPEFSGEKELSVRVKDVAGTTHESKPVKVKVDGSPKVLLQGIGPKQVLTAAAKLSISSNVQLENVSFVLTVPASGAERVLAADASQSATFTPATTDPSALTIRAVATYQGATVTGESVPFTIYLGAVYGPKAIIAKDQFLDLAAGLAKSSSDRTGMSTALQTAQAILETGWGQSVPVDKYSGKLSLNLFGIKGSGPNGSVTSNTWEVYNGVSYRIDAAFRAYNSVEESWDDRNNLLLTAARYEPFRAVMYDSTLGAWAVKRAGYATDPLYPIKLINIINQYDLLELDQVGI